MCSDGSGDALADLEAALDRLADVDLKAMFGSQVLERTGRLLRAQNRLGAALARSVREGEHTQAAEHDGEATMQSWLRGHPRLSAAGAARVVRTGRAMEQLPAVAAAFGAGRLTAEQVAAIAPVAKPENLAAAAAADIDVAEVDRVLAEVAATRTYDELKQVVHHYLARLDPDGEEPDPTEGRRLVIAKHADGSVTGRFDLDPVGGEKVQAVLEPMVQGNPPGRERRRRDQRPGDGPGRGPAQPVSAAGRRPGAVGGHRPGRREPAVAAHREAARGGHQRHR